MLRKILAAIKVLLLILPLFLAYYLFFYNNLYVRVESRKTDDNKVLITVLKNETDYPKSYDLITRLLQIPFNLTTYNICFKNKSYANELGYNEFLEAKDVTLEGIDKKDIGVKPFDIPPNNTSCQKLHLEKIIIDKATYVYSFKFFPSQGEFHYDISAEEKAEIANIDKWVITFLFSVAAYGILFLIFKIFYELSREVKILLGRIG
ncbi:MAG: hypothetical protein Q8R12_01325 [bacterium]|nr:hypothetical protein [bacterium]